MFYWIYHSTKNLSKMKTIQCKALYSGAKFDADSGSAMKCHLKNEVWLKIQVFVFLPTTPPRQSSRNMVVARPHNPSKTPQSKCQGFYSDANIDAGSDLAVKSTLN